MLGGEVGYTKLFGGGTHNRLGVTLAVGAQHYLFRGWNPMGLQNAIGPRLRLGWTF